MIRGTTPTHVFTLPFDTEILQNVRVIYSWGGAEKITKEAFECQLDGNTITVKLTQEDTLKFPEGKLIDIQIRALNKSGDVIASDIMSVHVCRCLDDEVI